MKISTYLITLITALSSHFGAFAQDVGAFSEIMETRILSPNIEEKVNRIKSVTKTFSDSHETRVVSKLMFDPGGYLTKFIDYFYTPSKGSVEYQFRRKMKNEAIMTAKIRKSTIEQIPEEHSLYAFREYVKHVKSPMIVINKVYMIGTDSIYRITTKINGKAIDSIYIPLLAKIENEIKNQIPDTTKYDSTNLGDTLRLERWSDKDSLRYLNRWYIIPSQEKPVKAELFTYRGDLLKGFAMVINLYDNKKRLISHSEFAGQPLEQLVSERTQFNDRTGEETIYHDSNPTSGRPKQIWTYNKHGKIISAIKYFDGYKNEERSIWEYNKKGLLIRTTTFLNNKLDYTISYSYTYYRNCNL